MTKHPGYKSFIAAKGRCCNVADKQYPDYGGRGIRFNFANFDELWTHIGDAWQPGLMIDRINNDGHYEIGNVRWATRIEQNRNKRNNVWVEHDGRRQTLAEWSREIGVSPATMTLRHQRFGADPAKLFAARR